MIFSNAVVFGGLIALADAQFPPEPQGLTVVKSKFHENVTISYKEASIPAIDCHGCGTKTPSKPGICETTPGVKSYSGYVHLPKGVLDDGTGDVQDFPINTFFWFFEARKDPVNAPLAIWLNGGPGGSSMMGLLQELGPCFINADSATTVLNPDSWNNEVNMLFLDQPAQVGFSYDVLINGTLVLGGLEGFTIKPGDFSDGVPESNVTHRVGTFPSQNTLGTVNSTTVAAHALWHFAQTWFFEFPFYKPVDNRVSLWAESYGGHYGPGFFKFFQEQNEKIKDGTTKEKDAHYIHLDTLGIVNGLVDMVVQGDSYISFPYNNVSLHLWLRVLRVLRALSADFKETYGIQLYNESFYSSLMHEWTKPDGCRDKMAACQASLKSTSHDPIFQPLTRKNLTKICGDLEEKCIELFIGTYMNHTDARGWFDIGHHKADPFPPPYLHGYLTQEHVLGALGVPLNYSAHSPAVGETFRTSYDIVHGGFLDAIAYLLDSGVKVHMMYGDRDFACNWIGGEQASLAVNYSRAADFAAAGYQPLLTAGGISGMTRQLGNFSFTRVFQSGHEVPAYQPVASLAIFERATFGKDISTGFREVTDDLVTYGPKSSWHIKNIPPKKPEPECYVLYPETCTDDMWALVMNGTAVIKDWIVVGKREDDTIVAGTGNEFEQQVFGEL
jgi:carboxypeptidase C (cathepsin A)